MSLEVWGFHHTRCNKRSNGFISKKLDRVLVSNDWLVKFENSEAIFLPPSISDHCPSVVKLGLQALVLKTALDEFSLLSGLLANEAKSNIFTLSLSSTTNQQLINIFGYTVGSLLIRYLGVEGDSKGAKISWSVICLPKKEGGLGIKDLSSWNKALMIRHLWILIYGMNNLWSSWIKAYHLKGSNLWEAKAPSTCSWNWRKLIFLRLIARPLIQHYIGNSSSTSLWFDNWHPDGPLLFKWSSHGVYDSGLPLNATVNAIILVDSWNWPAAMSIDLVEIKSRMPSYNPNSNIEDSILWLSSPNGIYSASSALASLRAPHPLVPWFKLVWFP
ncbi:hypothetical protein Ddye_013043 [Dipteronia dyeriana]|uniref:Reverse transcriptase zinc-binding domain-containing protein n=1 Tax=Dipteronia dyeriana TaxID=168575 RepID=A0AAE0CJ83_9ROSI|nr:hypothetical protein Ddye_013043 [Dipteronia dyeriana]